MIELTEQQIQAMENPEVSPPRVVNPRTKETFVLLRDDEYERLTSLISSARQRRSPSSDAAKRQASASPPIPSASREEDEYDDSPWTREEIEALAWKAGEHSGWDEYDDASDKS